MKRFLFALVTLLSFATTWAQGPGGGPGAGGNKPTITFTTTEVDYNGTATPIPAVTLTGGNTNEWSVSGVSETNTGGPTAAAPTHVGDWYIWIKKGQGNGDAERAVSTTTFKVKPAILKIDLLEIHKVYGTADPVLGADGMYNGKPWAKFDFCPGDGITNTTLENIVFKRIDAGEQAYDGESQIQYTYSLEEGVKANTTIGGVEYENYTVGVGQSSKLLIDKATLTVTVPNNSKTFGEDDPNFKTGATYSVEKDAAGNKIEDIIEITREEGENVTEAGYAFLANKAVTDNFEVTFVPAVFMINPLAITINATFPESYVYQGKNIDAKPTKVWYMNGSEEVVLKDGDYTVSYDAEKDRRNVTTGKTQNQLPTVTVTPAGNFKLGTAKTVSFEITPAELAFAIGDGSKRVGEDDPEPLADITFVENKGLVGTDNMSDGTIIIENTVVEIADLLKRETGEDVGQYAITVADNAVVPNYTIVKTDCTDGTFFIVRGDDIIVRIGRKEITYEDEYDLTELITVELPDGYVGSESVAKDLEDFVKTIVTKGQYRNGELVEVTTDNVGTYIVYIPEGPTKAGNYNVSYVNGSLVINRLNLYIQPDAAEKLYGEDDPEPLTTGWSLYKITGYTTTGAPIYTEYTKEGVKEIVPRAAWLGREPGLLNTYEGYGYRRANGGNIGEYRLYFGGSGIFENNAYGSRNADNYTFSTIDGVFTIKAAELIITVAGNEKTYGDANPAAPGNLTYVSNTNGTRKYTKGYLTIEITGATNFNQANTIANQITYGKAVTNGIQYRADGEVAGTYDIYNIDCNITGEGHNTVFNNYTVTFNEDKTDDVFTINKRKLQVKANDQSIPFGKEFDAYDIAIIGGNFPYPDGEPADVAKKDLLVVKRVVDNVEDSREKVFEPLTLKEDIGEIIVGKYYVNAFDEIKLTEFGAKNYEIEKQESGYLHYSQLDRIPLWPTALAELLNTEETPTLLKEVLAAHNGRTVTFVLPHRKMAKDDWYAWVLPFKVVQKDFFSTPIDYDDENDEYITRWGYGAMETLDVEKTTDKHVSFALNVIAPIEANTPFIVKVDKDITADEMAEIELPNKVVEYVENPVAGKEGCVQFVGLYEAKDDFDMTTRVLRRIPTNDDPLEFWPGVGAKLTETNAYLQFPTEEAAAGARIYIEEPDGSVTAIQGVVKNNVENNAEGVYNLNGMKIQGAPIQKGVYIQNGKKVVIK